MERLDLANLVEQPEGFHAALRATAGIDRFCSSLDWTLPAHAALYPPREPWLLGSEHGYAALARRHDPRFGTVLEPLEVTWGLGAPLLGPEPDALVRDFIATCRATASDWDLLILTGLPCDSRLLVRVSEDLSRRYRVLPGALLQRHSASLLGGVDGYLGRRAAKFRANLRAAERRAEQAGLSWERFTALSGGIYDRVCAIEARSWKGRAGLGVNEGPSREFYDLMVRRLAARKGLRGLIARLDGRDIGYLYGGTWDLAFRGLQFSYDAEHRALSLGNLAQLQMIRWLCGDGFSEYDLGTPVPYKARWAESGIQTTVIYAARR